MELAVVAVVTVVAVVLHVVKRRAVVAPRTEPVRWLAVGCLLLHGIVVAVRTLHTGSLVAARTSLTHVLQALDAVSHDALPLAEKRPLVTLLVLRSRRGFQGLFSIEGGDHETARGVLEEVDGDCWWIHGPRFDGGDLEGHGKQLDSCFGYSLGGVEVEGVASDA